jgi:hypothetical protein
MILNKFMIIKFLHGVHGSQISSHLLGMAYGHVQNVENNDNIKNQLKRLNTNYFAEYELRRFQHSYGFQFNMYITRLFANIKSVTLHVYK